MFGCLYVAFLCFFHLFVCWVTCVHLNVVHVSVTFADIVERQVGANKVKVFNRCTCMYWQNEISMKAFLPYNLTIMIFAPFQWWSLLEVFGWKPQKTINHSCPRSYDMCIGFLWDPWHLKHYQLTNFFQIIWRKKFVTSNTKLWQFCVIWCHPNPKDTKRTQWDIVNWCWFLCVLLQIVGEFKIQLFRASNCWTSWSF